MAKRHPFSYYFEGLKTGDTIVLSRAITLVESSLPEDLFLAKKLINACMPLSGKSLRIGITGTPGVGKSTFIDSFGLLLTKLGLKVAILSIDPSSVKTKGSILGDKTRMNRLAQTNLAYIRPTPASGTLGGVARKTRETIVLCEASGYDIVLIETVGVGQSELMVHAMVDFFLLLMLPHAGDGLQGIKKGIIEMADALVIHKADGDLKDKAMKAQKNYQQALHLFQAKDSEWIPKTLMCSSLEDNGHREIWNMIQTYEKQTKANGYWSRNRKNQAAYWLEETIREQLERYFYDHEFVKHQLGILREKVLKNEMSPIQAAEELIGAGKR